MRWIACLALAPLLPAQPNLSDQINGLLEASPAARTAFWGIRVVNPSNGEALYELNAERLFVPASNTKLFTAALALERLGDNHRFRTTVVAEKAPDASGRLGGDLRLVGGGDPTLTARPVPYRRDARAGDPLAALDELAALVAANGVRRIDGDIVGDDTAWVYRPYATGWAQDDLAWEYGAPVGALTLNDSSIEATLRPGSRAGEPAGITLQPAIEYFAIDNGVITVERGQGRIELDRMPGSRQIRLRGTIPLGGPAQTKRIAVDDPARFAAAAFYDALLRRGISVAGRAVAQHRFRTTATPSGERNPDAVVLAARISPPLADILQTLTKVSQNLYSETVLREVGRARRGNGSPEAGLAELHQFLTKADIRLDEYTWLDGSGLSRQNLVSPAAVTKLLVYMHNSPNRDLWKSLLPVAGEDGTLRYRFQEALLGQRVRAKTGTLAHVSALSGYAVREGADEVVFSILVNNHESPDSEIRSLIDKIVVAICQ